MNKEKLFKKINPKFLEGIAHRGLHNEKFTENGINAFKNAIDHDVAFEFDIHITSDGELIVCHDENLKRTTGKEGIIEHMTAKEIRDNYRLLDGGVVPTLQEVIDLNDGRVPMVIELKVFEKNYKPLAKKTIEILKQIENKRDVLLISFDPRSLWPLKKLGFIRSLLVAESDFYTWPFRFTVESIDIQDTLLKMPKVVRYAKKHFTNVWTIDSQEKLEKVLPYVDTVTYQFLDVELVKNSLINK